MRAQFKFGFKRHNLGVVQTTVRRVLEELQSAVIIPAVNIETRQARTGSGIFIIQRQSPRKVLRRAAGVESEEPERLDYTI